MSKLLSALAAKRRKKMADGGPVQRVDQKSQTPTNQGPKPTFWQDLKHSGWLGPNDMREEKQRRLDLERPKDSSGRHIFRGHMPIMQAEGGEVDKKDVKKKIEKKKGPDIRKGSTFKTRLVDEAEKHAESHAYNYDDNEAAKGVNKVAPVYNQTENKIEHGSSEAGLRAKRAASGRGTEKSMERAKEEHRKTLKELRDMPKPKLADGGEIHIDINSHKNDMEEMAEGGEIEDLGGHTSLADAIMAEEEPERDHMLELNAVEQPNNEDQLSFEALKKEIYSEDEALDQLDQPEDSNLHSPEHEDMDEHDEDLVQLIRRRLKKSPSME